MVGMARKQAPSVHHCCSCTPAAPGAQRVYSQTAPELSLKGDLPSVTAVWRPDSPQSV